MTSTPVAKPLKIDRLEISYRFESRNFFPVEFINDRLRDAVADNTARRLGFRSYPNSEKPSPRFAITLNVRPRRILVVETGIVEIGNGITCPYAKFEFNVQKLVVDDSSRASFHEAMFDLLPGGGYRELCENGYVLYAEFAADFESIDVTSIDAFSELTENGRWFPANSPRETISLGKNQGTREYSFTIYDKSKQERQKEGRLRRRQITRIEAKRRFNHTKIYRKIRLAELPTIENPFASLRIYESAKIAQALAASRHKNFLEAVQHRGIQEAFAGTRGSRRTSRFSLIEKCRVGWWAPESVWEGRDNAVREALELEQ